MRSGHAQNQFPDPYLLDPAGLAMFGAPAIRYDLPTLVFENGGSSSIYQSAGSVTSDLLHAWRASESRQISANVVSYGSGSLSCRFRGGAYVDLCLAGTGPSAPVTITAGTLAQGLVCRGVGTATFALRGNPANALGLFNLTP